MNQNGRVAGILAFFLAFSSACIYFFCLLSLGLMRRPQRHVKAQNSSAEESMISQQEITEAEIFKVTSFFYSTFFFLNIEPDR